MEQFFTVGQAGGTLMVREEGLRAVFEVSLPDDRRGLYKAYLVAVQGRFLLGTLMPSGGRLCLRRTLTIAELAQKRLWPVTGCETEMAFSFSQGQQTNPGAGTPNWHREEDPARLMGDRVLSHAARELRSALFCKEKDGFALAVPFLSSCVFPLTPLFCFAHIETLRQQPHAVFHFTGHGCPIFQNKGKEAGHTEGANQ